MGLICLFVEENERERNQLLFLLRLVAQTI